jgi:photosynthetic reaction center cytochrome c subunit
MRILSSTLAAALMLCLVLGAQDKGGAKGGGKGKAKAAPQNLKVLTADNFRPLMDVFVAALGLADKGGCTYCHVQGQMALDDKPQKVKARQMLVMVRDLNAEHFGGEQKVTCFTCHRGNPIPVTEPTQ